MDRKSLKFKNKELYLQVGQYKNNGNIAILAYTKDEFYGDITINLSGYSVDEDEGFIKPINKDSGLEKILIKNKKEMIYNVVAKSSYNNASELIRAGIDKELNLQMYKDNMDVIIKELSKLIDVKLDSFIKSQRKLNANNVRISALNTYIMGEVMSRILGDELHTTFTKILESGRVKANYFVNRNAEEISKEELLDFYGIGKVYRNE